MSENGDCFWSSVLGWSNSKTPGSSLTLLVMCIRSPPIQVANNGLNYCTFRLQVGERKKKTPLGSSLLVKANFKWFILSKKQQLHATSEDQITVFSEKGHQVPETSSGTGTREVSQSVTVRQGKRIGGGAQTNGNGGHQGNRQIHVCLDVSSLRSKQCPIQGWRRTQLLSVGFPLSRSSCNQRATPINVSVSPSRYSFLCSHQVRKA